MGNTFHWTDKRVLEFVKLATSGPYGIMKNKSKLTDKLTHYKKLRAKTKKK